MVAVLMSGSRTCWAQPARSATLARRFPRAGVDSGQRWRGGEGFGEEIEHGAEARWKQRAQRAHENPGAGGDAEAARVGEVLGNQKTAEPFEERAAAAFLGEGAERADQVAVFDSGRAGGFAGEATEAGVEMRGRIR